jgi:hypothetical protein
MFLRFNPWIFFDGTLYNIGLSRVELQWLFVCILVLLMVDLLHEKGHHLRDELLKQQF